MLFDQSGGALILPEVVITMMTNKKILVAVDESRLANDVVASAVELARSVDGKLRLVHAVVFPVQIPAPATFLVPQLQAGQLHGLVEAGRALLSRLVKSVPDELRDGTAAIVEIGPPAKTILAAARSYGADFVVIGAHEHNVMARALGTTAAKIADRIDRPLLVVRPISTSTSMSSSSSILEKRRSTAA